MLVAGFLCGLAMGLVLSVLGAGGSMFIVPALVFVLHAPISEATGTSLLIVGAAAFAAAASHWRRGDVVPKVAGIFGGAAMAGAVAGAALHPLVSDRAAMAIFAGIIFLAAGRMIWGQQPDRGNHPAARLVVLIPLGAAIGVLSGFVGVGGGFLIVPSLSWGARLPVPQAIGTGLAVVAAASLAGALSYAVQGQLSLQLLPTVGAGAVVGALVGAPLSRKIPERPLRLAFATLAIGVGIYMLLRVTAG